MRDEHDYDTKKEWTWTAFSKNLKENTNSARPVILQIQHIFVS